MRKTTRDWYECKKCGYAIDWFDMALTSTGKYMSTRSICKECYAKEKKLFYKNNTEYHKNQIKQSQLRNKGKQEARYELNKAIKRGELVRQPCEVCGTKKTQGHHSDYMKPLEVKWLCSVHHGLIHRSFDKEI